MKTTIKIYLFLLLTTQQISVVCPQTTPRVSIICSVYDSDKFIEGFLSNIARQTIFDECELILINANSPGNEESIINKYITRYPNIVYAKLDHDPGVYGAWNYGIKLSSAPLITNANIDDRRNPKILEIHATVLENNPSIELVYSGFYLTRNLHDTFESHNSCNLIHPLEFAPKNMYQCLPGPMPMWRKSMHEKYGYFDETFFSSGDWEFWNRAASMGAQLKKIDAISGIYYLNPKGVSTDPARDKKREQEDIQIIVSYCNMWGLKKENLIRANYKP